MVEVEDLGDPDQDQEVEVEDQEHQEGGGDRGVEGVEGRPWREAEEEREGQVEVVGGLPPMMGGRGCRQRPWRTDSSWKRSSVGLAQSRAP